VNQSSNNESASVASVNNDWKHLVTLQGNEKAIEEDIQGIGKVIGVSFAADPNNKLSMLSRSKKVDLGPVLRPVQEGGGKVGGGSRGVGAVLFLRRGMVEMKVVSWNARGLGGLEKRREVKQLVNEKCSFIMCIQETKLIVIDGAKCASL